MNTTSFFDQLLKGFNSNVSVCSEWKVPQGNTLFLQLANLCIFFGILFSSTSIYSLLFLRTGLIVSNVVTVIWAGLINCSADLLLWNAVFALINLVHIIILLVKLHPFIR